MTESNHDRPRAYRIPAEGRATSSPPSQPPPRESGPFSGWTAVQKLGAVVGSLVLLGGTVFIASVLTGRTTSPNVPTTLSAETPADAGVSAPSTDGEAPSDVAEVDTPVAILQAAFTSDQGYQYEVDMLEPDLSVLTDIANAPPGKAHVSSSSLATFVLHNRNPGRNAPIPLMVTFPVWKADSPMCSYLPTMPGPAFNNRDDYCGPGTLFGVQFMAPPGQRLDNFIYWPNIDVDASIELIGFYDIGERALSVEEQDVDAIVRALESPDAFVLATKVDPDNAGEYVCHLGDIITNGRSFYVVASTVPIDGC